MLYILILLIPVLIYAALSALILFHLKKYGITGDFTRQIIILFFIVSVILLFSATWSFFSISWSELNPEIFQGLQNNNPVFNQ